MDNRREELEREIEIVQNKVDNPPPATPKEIIGSWKKELDSLSFELNNLYDDDEGEGD